MFPFLRNWWSVFSVIHASKPISMFEHFPFKAMATAQAKTCSFAAHVAGHDMPHPQNFGYTKNELIWLRWFFDNAWKQTWQGYNQPNIVAQQNALRMHCWPFSFSPFLLEPPNGQDPQLRCWSSLHHPAFGHATGGKGLTGTPPRSIGDATKRERWNTEAETAPRAPNMYISIESFLFNGLHPQSSIKNPFKRLKSLTSYPSLGLRQAQEGASEQRQISHFTCSSHVKNSIQL